MKGLLVIALVTAACSAKAKQDPGEPQPMPTESGSAPLPPATAGPAPSRAPTPPTSCPALQIKAPDVVSAGQPGRFTLIMTDAGGTPTMTWKVSGGTIASGQGTTSITVTTSVPSGTPVTATVELGNLPAVCVTRSVTGSFLVGA